MSHFEWDVDELLNFDYDKPVPDGRSSTNDAQLYAEIRRKEEEKAIKEAQLREYMASARRAAAREQEEIDLRAQRVAALSRQKEAEASQRAAEEQARRNAELRARQMADARAEAEAHMIEQHERQLQAAMQQQQAARQQMTFGEPNRSNNQSASVQRPVQRPVNSTQSAEAQRIDALKLEAQRAEERAAAQRAEAQRAAYERYRAETRNQHATKEERKYVNNQIREDQKALKQEKRDARKSSKNSSRASSKANKAEYKLNNNGKGSKKKSGSKVAKNSKGAKALSVLYLIAMVVFSVAMLIMNVLPFKYLILMYAILLLLSAIIVTQLRGYRVKKWARGVAVFMSVVLTIVFGVGTAYALGTLSFLGNTTVKNEDSVAKITEDPFNVVMTGIDVSGTIDEQGRSDVNMIVTVNPETSTILMTSIPRDYEVRLPDKGYATDKLTHTGFYGVETTILAEEDLFGIESNYYVKVNFSTVRNFINAIGGVDVYSEYTFNPVKRKSWTVQEGMNHMNGDEALAFARERKAFATGDNQRIKNQQAVFEALIEKATSSKTMAISYGKILNQLEDYFEMSFSSNEIRNLMKYQIAANPDWKIYKNTVSGPGANKATYSGGSQKLYVMEQDPTQVANAKVLINAVLEGKQLQKDESGVVSVVATE